MSYRVVEAGIGTQYSETPSFRVHPVPDGPVAIELSFQVTPAPMNEVADFAMVRFESVLEYRWIAADQFYLLFNRDDHKFALIEIVDSEQIEQMLRCGTYRSRPKGDRLGGTLKEDRLHHLRILFDGYGCFDVICLSFRIERFQERRSSAGASE